MDGDDEDSDDWDGWELDDWEDEAFDDGLWDQSQANLDAGVALGEGESPEALDRPAGQWGMGAGEGPMGWSAWEVGTAFALGGWLADRHAEQVGRQVADALRAAPAGATADQRPDTDRRSAPHPPPATGHPYNGLMGTTHVGEPLEQGSLFSDLIAALAYREDRVIQAEGDAPAGARLVLVMTAVPASTGPRLWVVAEDRPDGFSATRLIPVFQPDREAGVAVFASDYVAEAADAAVWACQREGVALDTLTVTHRR